MNKTAPTAYKNPSHILISTLAQIQNVQGVSSYTLTICTEAPKKAAPRREVHIILLHNYKKKNNNLTMTLFLSFYIQGGAATPSTTSSFTL
jgi:hypothetical protein